MHGTGETLSPNGTIFAEQLINLYTKSIGHWAYYVIAAAAITTMISTTITCLDAYPRVLTPLSEILIPKIKGHNNLIQKYSWVWIIILAIGVIIILGIIPDSMHFMVDMATTLSFVTASILAVLNYLVVTDKHMPLDARPKSWLKIYAWTGIVFLGGFTLVYLLWNVISI